MNNKFLLAIAGVILVITVALTILLKLQLGKETKKSGIDVISKSQGAAIVKDFFTLVGQNKIEDASKMLTTMMVGSEEGRSKYMERFSIFEKLEIKNIESVKDNTYKVTFDVKLKTGLKNNYDWINGSNVRYVITEKDLNQWRIGSITTSI